MIDTIYQVVKNNRTRKKIMFLLRLRCRLSVFIMEDGSRFGHFWWFYARVYYVYILIDQPYSDRNLMVLWAKAPGFNARHFAVLWFDPQSSHIFFS